MSTDTLEYQGTELHLFAHARRWKDYWSSRVRPLVAGDVLEVGAGLGANTGLLHNEAVRSWHCLEPDRKLASELRKREGPYRVIIGTTEELQGEGYDVILYIDVLEHIEADRAELMRATALLRPGGRIVVLSPAHQMLYSPFDASIGHCRRYNRRSLIALEPPGCRLEAVYYLDSAGMFASLANRALLKQSMPSLRQIVIWDTYLVPISRLVDPLLGYRVGKSIVAVWRRNATTTAEGSGG
jgi:SAM-dependent methyltransferase